MEERKREKMTVGGEEWEHTSAPDIRWKHCLLEDLNC